MASYNIVSDFNGLSYDEDSLKNGEKFSDQMDSDLTVLPYSKIYPAWEVPKLNTMSEHIMPNSCSLIVFDLETSGLSLLHSEILQVSAVCNEKPFNMYCIPKHGIPPMASSVNNLTLKGNVMFYKNRPVSSYSLDFVLESFLHWLSELPKPRILLGHNIRRFDCPHLYKAITRYELLEFVDLVEGFVDTIPMFQEIYPSMKNYTQSTLVQTHLKKQYEEHNALEDVRALEELIKYSKISDSIYLCHSITSKSMLRICNFDMKRKELLEPYHHMICVKALSQYMADKLSKSRLSLKILREVFVKGGKEELESLLGEKINGKIRITDNKSVINSIVDYLKDYMI